MIILGIGTNLGDRLGHLRTAVHFIKKIPRLSVKQVSPVYLSDALLPDNAPAHWNKPHLNLALRCETQLSPHEILQQVKDIEKKMGRVSGERWGPRIIDIDILAWDDLNFIDETLQIPHKELFNRPFALWPLQDVAPCWRPNENDKWGSRFSGDAPFHTRQIAQRVDAPALVGIINAAPDSFSDGGNCLDADNALMRAKQLVLEGAEIIDIGAEATNPRATAISAEEEWRRLAPVLQTISAESANMLIPPKISIDTRHFLVAERALASGISWINDVSGGDNHLMRELLIHHKCDVVIMHHLGIPVDRNKILPLEKNSVDQVLEWAKQRLDELTRQGISRERIIFDPGIGFGKNSQQCLELIKHVERFQELGTRVLIGHSRKIFLGQFTPRPFIERDIETAAISFFLANKPVDYLRVHHVDMQARMIKISASIMPIL